MFPRCNRRVKDGKAHDYWNVVESRLLSDGRVVQHQVLYLGEINASQREVWRKTIEVHDEGTRRQVALFAAGSMPAAEVDALGARLNELRPERLRPSREGTPWLHVFKTLEAYQLIDPRLRVATAPPVVRCERHGRSSTAMQAASRRASSLHSWPTDCRSRSRPGCARWPAASRRTRR